MIKIICFGKIKESYMQNFINDYLHRINKYHKIELIELKDDPDQDKETKSLLGHIKESEYLILLDVQGEEYTSEEFAQLLDKSFLNAGTISFIIGSSVGVDEQIKKMCHKLVSFSKLTMPHGVFRGVLLEQIYRAFKINNNETYHK